MAKNYTVKEIVAILQNNQDYEAMLDIGKRYPLLSIELVKNIAIGKDTFCEFMSYMPDYLTANKLNSAIKAIVLADEEDEGEDEENGDEEITAKVVKAKEIVDETDDEEDDDDEDENEKDYTTMTGKELWAIAGERGIRKLAVSTKKADLIKLLEDSDSGKLDDTKGASAKQQNKKVIETDRPDFPDDDEEENESEYEGMSAVELFKECKKRGIKAAPKKESSEYIKLLVKDDEKNITNDEAEDDEDDDWDI